MFRLGLTQFMRITGFSNSHEVENKFSQRSYSLFEFISGIRSANFCASAKFCCPNPLAKVLKVSSVSHINYEQKSN